ncbi:MAG TPA: endonuclease III [Isosphaeraceae bacterium]
MPNFTESVAAILSVLDVAEDRDEGLGPPPGTFESVAAAYLAQWGEVRAVAQAIEALRDEGWLEPEALAAADEAAVADAWREAGARGLLKLIPTLQRLARWAAPSLRAGASTESLRDGLRGVKGVGAASADAILLRGIGRVAYPVDRATYRIVVRHGWLDPSAGYDEARSLVEAALPDDPTGLASLSAGFEQVGRLWCRASVAKCERCPLRPLLPEGGPLGES